jgi:hypothetical protein
MFIIIFSKTTWFNQADHQQVFIYKKIKTQGKLVNLYLCDCFPCHNALQRMVGTTLKTATAKVIECIY